MTEPNGLLCRRSLYVRLRAKSQPDDSPSLWEAADSLAGQKFAAPLISPAKRALSHLPLMTMQSPPADC